MALKIFNTLSGEKEEFVPLTPGRGAHVRVRRDRLRLGASGALPLSADLRRDLSLSAFSRLRRDLRAQLHRCRRQNHQTGQRRAGELGNDHASAISENSIKTVQALGLLAPSVEPLATQHIAEIIDIIEQLEAKDSPIGSTATFIIPSADFRATASCPGKISTSWRLERALKSTSASARRSISLCGNRASLESRRGTAHGDQAGRAGISNARR